MKEDVGQDCRIIGTTMLGKDVYRCSTETGAARPKQGTRQKRKDRSTLKVQALMKAATQNVA